MNMLGQLALLFGKLSLLAVGGINSTLPEIARNVVQDRHWLTPGQFSQLYAIAQAAPGPNMMVATVIGAHVAGIAGGLIATLAIITPSGILVMIVANYWDRFREAKWRRITQAALLPITAGLILAAACVLVRQADDCTLTIVITAISTALLWRTGVHPLWLLAGGAMAGLCLA